jgi:hypothetical protein
MIGGGGVSRIDAADAVEGVRIAFEDAGEVAVVPPVVDDLDDDGAEDIIGVHEVEELFDRGVLGGWVGSRGEGKSGVVPPDVDVGVDERRGK